MDAENELGAFAEPYVSNDPASALVKVRSSLSGYC